MAANEDQYGNPLPHFDTPSPSSIPIAKVGVDEFGTTAGTPGFDPNSTAREAALAPHNVGGPTVIAPNSAADEWNATFQPGGENYSLTASQYNRENPILPAIGRRYGASMRPFEDLHGAATDYHQHTAEAVRRSMDAEKSIESADFARKIATLDHSSPDYPIQFANLVAQHPNAGGKLVDEVVAQKQGARDTFQKAMQNGGATAYGSADNPTEAYRSYIDAFQRTKDPTAAKNAAEATLKNQAKLDDAAGQGLFSTEKDLPPWQAKWRLMENDSTRPKIYNRNGSINYGEANKIIAERRGAGEALKDQTKQLEQDRLTVQSLGPQIEKTEKEDPAYSGLVQQRNEALDRLNAHSEKLKTNSNAAPATPPSVKKYLQGF